MAACLPLDILTDILLRLPVKSLLRLKLVCKAWFNLINNSDFIKLHLHKSYDTFSNSITSGTKRSLVIVMNPTYAWIFNLDDLDSIDKTPTKLDWLPIGRNLKCESPNSLRQGVLVIGSCNGLICFSTAFFLLICNPSTRAFKKTGLPDMITSVYGFWINTHICMLGFGYDSENDDYMIVMRDPRDKQHTFVYSLKADQWSTRPSIEKFVMGDLFEDCSRYNSDITDVPFTNNRLHWIVQANKEIKIARFDLGSKGWERFIQPPSNKDSKIVKYQLEVLEGCLCLCSYSSSPWILDVWIMKEYGVQESWTKMAGVPWSDDISTTPIACARRKHEILFRKRNHLARYDRQLETFSEIISYQGIGIQVGNSYCEVQLYAETLVPIPAGNKVQTLA